MLSPRYFCYTIFMASYISHYLAAKAVIEKTGNSLIKEYADCFILGAQGGDLLFYAFGQFKGYGARTHKEKTAEIFSAALDYCRREKRPEPLAYTLGLLTHYALDSTAHPYVVYEAKERLSAVYPPHLDKCLHMMLETRIDCEMKKRAKEFSEDCALKKVIPTTKRAAKSLADVWYNAIDKVFDADVPYKLLLKLPSRMYRYQKVFLKPRSLSCAVLRFACKKMDYPAYIQGFFLPDKNTPAYDVMNIEKRPFPSYTGSSLQKSENWFDLFDEAVDKGVELIGLYCKGTLPVDPALFRVNFSGGLSE